MRRPRAAFNRRFQFPAQKLNTALLSPRRPSGRIEAEREAVVFMKLSANIRRMRKEKGLTQEQVAQPWG